jgi:hypothetical protein
MTNTAMPFKFTNWLSSMTYGYGNSLVLIGDKELKTGDSIIYSAGYKVFASSTATVPTASASGSSKFTIIDGATALSLSAGVAAAIAMIAF